MTNADDLDTGFEQLFGRSPTFWAHAPGRVNLIGEHTDYNGGFVMPIATPQQTQVAMVPRGDGLVRAWSGSVPAAEQCRQFRIAEEIRTGGWIDYVAGVTAALRQQGHPVNGFDVRVASNLPLGGGLSSSASLEVALLRALNESFSLGLDPVAIARIAHAAETGLVGAPVGVMDQFAASLADPTRALFLDTLTLQFERLSLPEGSAIIVIYSGITHRHADGEYATRRAECEAAARGLGVQTLREVSVGQLESLRLADKLARRVRHVVTENERVLQARDALRRGAASQLGHLMNASHASLRDDYEVSTPEIDLLVALAQAQAEVFGARLTGGGFGGSIVALSRRDVAPFVARRIAAAYAERVAQQPIVLIPQ